jgi:putative transposase
MSKRRTHSPGFKARVAMEAISGRKKIHETAPDHPIHPIQVSQWKMRLLEGTSELLNMGKKTKDKEEAHAKEEQLLPYIGRLQRGTSSWDETASRDSVPLITPFRAAI